MRKNATLIKTSIIFLVLSLVLSCIPTRTVSAQDGVWPQADVWTNKGGQGLNAPDGTFKVGEETIVYAAVNMPCQAKWVLWGPHGKESEIDQSLNAAGTYTLSLGRAEEKDIGQWQVNFYAVVGQRYAADIVKFTVVAAAPAPTPPTSPPFPPPTGVQAATAKVDAASAIELDALTALKMAEGMEAPDLNMDANGDGKVTKEDACLILEWSVTSPWGLLSPPQQEIVDTFGPPSHFSVTYLLDSVTESNAVVRTEIWFYPVHQKKITFIAGDINSVDDLPPLGDKVAYSDLKPEDFDCFMNYEQVAAKIGGTVLPAELLPEAFTEVGLETYLGDKVMFIMSNGHLVHLETFGVEGQLSTRAQLKAFLASLNPASLLAPSPTLAKGPDPKQAFGWLWKQTKKGTRFVNRVPEKVAGAVLPPKVVPFAVAVAEFKCGRLPVWRAAAKVNDVAMMENELKKARDSYREQAKNVGDLAKTLKAEQDRLNQGPTKLGMDVLDWQEQRKLLDELIPKLEAALSKLNRDADRLNIGDIARIGLGDVIQKTLGNIEKIVLREIGAELHRLGVENVIRILLEKGPKGLLDAKTVIDLIINGDISRMSEAKGLDPGLKDKIREEIKNELKKQGLCPQELAESAAADHQQHPGTAPDNPQDTG